MCTVYDFQRFGNIHSPQNLTGNPKTTNQRLHCAPSTPSTRSMEQPDIYPYIKNTLLGQLFLPCGIAAFLSEDGPPPEHVSTTPLPLSLPNLSSKKFIQYFLTESSISGNTYIQLGFTSSDFLGKFMKLFKTFATSDMDNRKDISSGNSIDFDKLSKIYAHISGGWKIQTTPTDACKYDGAQLIVANISPLRPLPETSKHLSPIFGCFDIDEGNPLHL